ncbi:MAG TPA: hypothetical protein VNW99_04165 [Cytophagaceae bacterium]|nr:hypothetical protein [Cytophagaceae bacterium]
MNTEKTLSPQESLNIIADTIALTKENIKENSFCFLLWGWLLTISSFSFFLLHQYTSFEYYFLPFPVLVAIGIITTVVWYLKKTSSKTETYGTFFLSRMWLVLGICFITVVFINVSQKLPPFTYTLLIAGIGALVSGLVMKFKPLSVGGILFLCAAITSIYILDDYKVLLQGVAIITGFLIPGYMLKYSNS